MASENLTLTGSQQSTVSVGGLAAYSVQNRFNTDLYFKEVGADDSVYGFIPQGTFDNFDRDMVFWYPEASDAEIRDVYILRSLT